MQISEFVKEKRSAAKLTQPELAEKAGVGLRFLRELEQGKQTLRIDKINQVLRLFGYEVGAVAVQQEEETPEMDKRILLLKAKI
jgi:y4mF family transcriptional regulator